ncbi:hypothetical protein [Thermostaphylospora chromogena]|nr:hypothetical protein [Thermostaphylospora chromogena]
MKQKDRWINDADTNSDPTDTQLPAAESTQMKADQQYLEAALEA